MMLLMFVLLLIVLLLLLFVLFKFVFYFICHPLLKQIKQGFPVSDYFSVRWTGLLTTNVTGWHTIRLAVSQGYATVFLQQMMLIPETTGISAPVYLIAGRPVPIQVDARATTFTTAVQLYWTQPGKTEVAIPSSAYSYYQTGCEKTQQTKIKNCFLFV